MPMPMPFPAMTFRLPFLGAALAVCAAVAGAQAPAPAKGGSAQPNPYKLEPFEPDFPVALEYPPHTGVEYVRTRRQILERLAQHLQGNVRRDTWLAATEFFWRAPEDAVEPLVTAMDRAFGKPGLDDAVKNVVEAMGRAGHAELDPALRRALQHPNPGVQQAAFASLAMAGKEETVRELAAAFQHMDARARGAWLRAARLRLGEEGVALLRDAMMADHPPTVRDQVLHEALLLPPAQAAVVLRGRWDEAIGEFKAVLAGVLHAAGDERGTAWLRDALQSDDPELLALAVRHAAVGEVGELRQPLLLASTHLRPEVRHEVAKALTRVSGDDVADVYELLASPDEPWEVRSIALRELTRRGRPQVVGALLDELPTASGTRLDSILGQLAASGDPRAVPVLLERFHKAPAGESRPFLQALAQNHSAPAAQALFELFRGPELVVGRGQVGELTTRNYIPTLLLNVRGNERAVLAEFLALPREQWRLRAPLLPTLAGIAADRRDPELEQECIAPLRAILFDREELPQMRVLALNQLARRWLTIDDVLRLKSMHRDEAPGLRRLLSDFLGDQF